jgi:hypothetical protein
MNATAQLCLSALVLATGSSCASSRWYEHTFVPAPLEVRVETEAVSGAQARVLITILGLERAGEGHPDQALVRMRIENLGTTPVELAPGSLELVSADLVAFGAAVLAPDAIAPIAKDESASYDVAFPLPSGRQPYDLNLSGLNLRWTLIFAGHEVTTGASFQRVHWGWGYGEPQVHVGMGFGYVHCG